MKYGLPYKGSKNKLAERIVRFLPKRDNLVDLFCGGCAVSHAALLMGKYKHIHINDLNWMCPTLFIDALNGKYNDDTRWISREDFFRLRDTDPYVAVVWSFGNNLRDYLYSQEIEPLKRAIHYAIFFSDYEPGRELGHDLSFVDGIGDVQRRYIAVKRYFSQFGHFQQQSFEGGQMQVEHLTRTMQLNLMRGQAPRLQHAEAFSRLNTNLQSYGGGKRVSQIGDSRKTAQYLSEYHPLERTTGGVFRREQTPSRTATPGMSPTTGVSKKKTASDLGKPNTGSEPTALHRLQYRERQHSMPARQGGQSLPITSSVLDYAEVEIPKGSVIYCDIPYEGTNVYNGAEHFDYERFYRWAESQTEPVFISSYDMPRDRFDCVAEWDHRSTLNDRNNNAVKERIFVPKNQTERGNIPPRTLSLFDDF